jgi:integrase
LRKSLRLRDLRCSHLLNNQIAHLGPFASPEFEGLDAISQRTRRGVIEGCLMEPLTPDSKLLLRDCPYARVDAKHIKMLRDRKKDAPGAANNRKKYLSAMFGWAIEQTDIDVRVNPCRDVKRIKVVSDGWYTWTLEDVAKFIERHPKGTMPYLALCLMLFLGARRQDAIRLGPKNRRGDVMRYVPKKTSYVRKEESVKPVLKPLVEAIDATAHGIDIYLLTSHGKQFSDAGFGNWMRERCDEAGLPECTSHGLKKIAATIVANMGATDRQMMMLFDWKTEKMANVYTRMANKEKLAADAARLLGAFFEGTSQALIENKAHAG